MEIQKKKTGTEFLIARRRVKKWPTGNVRKFWEPVSSNEKDPVRRVELFTSEQANR